jgi:hypothetical protein
MILTATVHSLAAAVTHTHFNVASSQTTLAVSKTLQRKLIVTSVRSRGIGRTCRRRSRQFRASLRALQYEPEAGAATRLGALLLLRREDVAECSTEAV